MLEAGFYRKLLVLRTLEAKFLKNKSLCGLMLEREPGATPRVHRENTAPTNRVAD
jgi:hypothetical protein